MAPRITLLFCIFYFITQTNFGQTNDDFIFGFQLRPIVPNGYLKADKLQVSSDKLTYSAYIKPSLSFGAILRKPLGKFWNLETGINLIRRNYRMNFNLQD